MTCSPSWRHRGVLRSLTGPLDDTVPAARAITVRHLLTSTNGHGFPSDFSAPVVQLLFERLHQGPPQPQRVPPPEEWMAILADIPLLHQPGEAFTYNTAFDILGVLVARAGGRPLPDLMATRILEPLGMTETGFAFPAGTDHRRTCYYRHDGDGLVEDRWSRRAVVDGAGVPIGCRRPGVDGGRRARLPTDAARRWRETSCRPRW